MKYVCFYGGPMSAGHNPTDDERRRDDEGLMAQIRQHYPAHKARVERFHAEGKVLMIGTFSDPIKDGSMGVWRRREDIEEFMAGDPFVVNKLIRSWRIIEWNESLFP